MMIKYFSKWTHLALAMIYWITPAIGRAAELPRGIQLAPVQQLVRGNSAEVESLDPHKIDGVPEANIIHELYEGLVNFGIQGEIVPGVASSWRTTDQKTWIFSLRPEAKWSTGEPVTAGFCLQLAAVSQSGNRGPL